jgi:hypothetical protein
VADRVLLTCSALPGKAYTVTASEQTWFLANIDGTRRWRDRKPDWSKAHWHEIVEDRPWDGPVRVRQLCEG